MDCYAIANNPAESSRSLIRVITMTDHFLAFLCSKEGIMIIVLWHWTKASLETAHKHLIPLTKQRIH